MSIACKTTFLPLYQLTTLRPTGRASRIFDNRQKYSSHLHTTEAFFTRSAFTMIELLVVIAILCILFSLLLPAASGSISKVNIAMCSGNLRQLGQSITLYSQDNQGLIPNAITGMESSSIPILRLPDQQYLALGRLYKSYLEDLRIFGCPASPGYTPDEVERRSNTSVMLWSAYLYRNQCSGFQPVLNSPVNANKAIVMDFACITAAGEQFAPHNYLASNLLYSDCRVETRRNSRTPFELYTAQAARHGSITPDCTKLWQNSDE